MTPSAVRRGGEGRDDPLRGRPGVARRGAGRRDRQGRVRDHARRRSRRPRRASLQDRFPRAELMGGDPALRAHGRAGRRPGRGAAVSGLDLPLDIRGTAFQERVWQALRAIPPGRTATYAEIARAVGRPKAVRAVAQACAANPLAVAIPCHRVVQDRRRSFRLSLGRRAQARAHRPRGGVMRALAPTLSREGRGGRRRQSLSPGRRAGSRAKTVARRAG